MATSLRPRPEAQVCDKTRRAQLFLDAAAQSVQSALDALDLARDQRRKPDGSLPQGRLTDGEEDLLRTAIVFAGAGLDSSLKQLIRDALFALIHVNEDADEKLTRFTERYLSEGDIGVNPKRLAKILLKGGLALPREAIIAEYISELTGESLQSVNQVSNVCGALGVNESALRMRLSKGSPFDKMFVARNQIVHELDLTERQSPRTRSKRGRKLNETVEWASEALSVAQEILNSVTVSLAR